MVKMLVVDFLKFLGALLGLSAFCALWILLMVWGCQGGACA
jgi:hypothetical protein